MIEFLRRHRLLIICVMAGMAALVWLVLAMRGKSSLGHPDAIGPTVFSKSAIGHAAFFGLLDDLDFPVTSSVAGSGGHLEPGSLLVIAEPRSDSGTLDEVRAMLIADSVVLALPKRVGEADRIRPNWLGRAEILASDDVTRVLRLVDERASIVRVESLGPIVASRLGSGKPVIHRAQLMRSSSIKPLLASPDGVLIGEYTRRGRRVVVLADPDLISNFGLGQGDNATIAVRLIEYSRHGRDGMIVFDEFIHGFADRPFHILGILFQFPFALVTVQIAFAAALLIWAASARFGTPPEMRPGMAAGKRSLIETGAQLLDRAGHRFVLSRRYFEAMIRDAGRQAHAPRGLDFDGLVNWLSRTGQVPPPALPSEQNDHTATSAAKSIFEWKKGLRDES